MALLTYMEHIAKLIMEYAGEYDARVEWDIHKGAEYVAIIEVPKHYNLSREEVMYNIADRIAWDLIYIMEDFNAGTIILNDLIQTDEVEHRSRDLDYRMVTSYGYLLKASWLPRCRYDEYQWEEEAE